MIIHINYRVGSTVARFDKRVACFVFVRAVFTKINLKDGGQTKIPSRFERVRNFQDSILEKSSKAMHACVRFLCRRATTLCIMY